MKHESAYMRVWMAGVAAVVFGVPIVFFFFSPTRTAALSIDHSDYAPGQTINVTCSQPSNVFEIYDITPGIDGVPSNGGHVGLYDCATLSSVTFDGLTDHTYAVVELAPGSFCNDPMNEMVYASCLDQPFVRAEVQFTIRTDGGTSASVVSPVFHLDKSVYTPDETVEVTCSYSRNMFQVYDITPGINGEPSNGGELGVHSCLSNTTLTDTWTDGHAYTVVELDPGSTCTDVGYEACITQPFVRSMVNFSVNTDGGSESPTTPTGPGLSASTYSDDESISIMCTLSTGSYELYDITAGIDGEPAYGGDIGNYSCTDHATLRFNSRAGHTYATVELAPNTTCENYPYASCTSQSFVRGIYRFSVTKAVTAGFQAVNPEVKITAPKEGTTFGTEGVIDYSVTDKNDRGGSVEREKLGLTANPVSIYYTDKIAEWDHTIVRDEDKTLIAKGLPAKGPYTWSISGLTPGVFYRIVVDAVDALGAIGESVSDFFTVDFEQPTFTVTASPSVTRREPVTITVDASKEIVGLPVVEVTQKGAATSTVITMTGTSTHFEGTYEVQEGYDGIATIEVRGTDRVGNIGTTLVSGGTFAVGVNPPPKPTITSPLNNDLFATNTIAVTGEARADTLITVKVNGADTYTASTTPHGTFAIPGVILHPEVNRGLNTVSVSAIDVTGIASENASVQVRYNLPPTVRLIEPREDASVGASVTFIASSTDANLEPVLFTYQVIPADELDGATSTASTSRTQWTTIAENVPTSQFVWDSTEQPDGHYFVRVIADDGHTQVTTLPRSIMLRNQSSYFRFEDGRVTRVGTSTATVIGRALAPTGVTPRPTITGAAWSRDNGQTWTPIVLTSGSGTPETKFTVRFTDLEAGTNGILWRVTDSRGLSGKISHPVIVDATSPTAPTVLSPRGGAIIADTNDIDRTRRGMQIDVTARAEPRSIVTLTYASTTRTTRANVDGTVIFRSVDVTTRGEHTFTLSAADEAGNTSTATRASFIYDNPPEVHILEPKPFRGLARTATLQWRITDPDNDPLRNVTLSYRRSTEGWIPLPIDPTARSYTWDLSGFTDARDYQLRLEASDGYVTSRDIVDFSVDTTPPTLTQLSLIKDILGIDDTVRATGQARDALSGIEYVEYGLTGSPTASATRPTEWVTSIITSGFLGRIANFSITHPTPLTDGIHTLFVRAVDASGNTSEPATREITVDTTAPRAGTFTITLNTIRLTSDAAGNIALYADIPALFGVSLEADATRATLYLNDTEVPLTYNVASGLWESTITISGGEPVALAVAAADRSGNVSPAQSLGTVTPLARGTVSVINANGTRAALPNAHIRVRILNQSTNTLIPVNTLTAGDPSTDDSGHYTLVLGAGTYELTPEAPGFEGDAARTTLTQSGIVHTNLDMKPYTPPTITTFFQKVMQFFTNLFDGDTQQ